MGWFGEGRSFLGGSVWGGLLLGWSSVGVCSTVSNGFNGFNGRCPRVGTAVGVAMWGPREGGALRRQLPTDVIIYNFRRFPSFESFIVYSKFLKGFLKILIIIYKYIIYNI